MPPETARTRLCELVAARIGFSPAPLNDRRIGEAITWLRTVLPAQPDEDAFAALAAQPLDSDAWQGIIDSVTVKETSFFRQRDWFAQVERCILVPLIAMRASRGPRQLRIWSAGCATGEEPYTLAMILDRLIPERRSWDIRIVGTDISARALDAARHAAYRPWALRELDDHTRNRYFTESARNRHELVKPIRDMVDFRLLNLVTPGFDIPGDGAFDVIFCRNVIMYWKPEVQRAVAQRLVRCLAPGGWLVVSPAEAVADWYRPLRPVNLPDAIFFRKIAPEEVRAARPPRRRAEETVLPMRPPPAPAPSVAPTPAAPLRPHVGQTGPTTDSDGAMKAARMLADRGARREAREACTRILAADSLHCDAYLLLAEISEEMGDSPAALAAVRSAIYAAPDSALAHFRLGALLASAGRTAEARRSFDTVLALLRSVPEDALAESGIGVSAGALLQATSAYLAAAVPNGNQRRSHG